MSNLCTLCPICYAPREQSPRAGCPAPGYHATEEASPFERHPLLVEAARLSDRIRVASLEAWLRGAPLPLSGGYRPADAPEFP